MKTYKITYKYVSSAIELSDEIFNTVQVDFSWAKDAETAKANIIANERDFGAEIQILPCVAYLEN